MTSSPSIRAATVPQTPEISFRSSLEDVATIAAKLAPYLESSADVVEVCKLGMENESQLRLLMGIVAAR